MKVKLLAHTPNAEQVIASAAKLCYSPVGVEEIQKDLTEEEIKKFLDVLVKMGHESPVEHVTFTFAIEGISRSCSHQIVRHRIASFSQQSQRYVDMGNFEYIIPPEIEKNENAKIIYVEYMKEVRRAYCEMVDALMSEGRNEKQAFEDARYVLPNACETKMVFTINARSLLNFFNHRCCERAQWEIRNVANEMLRQVKEVAPTIFKYAGPKCIKGKCPEGKMSCGNPKGC